MGNNRIRPQVTNRAKLNGLGSITTISVIKFLLRNVFNDESKIFKYIIEIYTFNPSNPKIRIVIRNPRTISGVNNGSALLTPLN